MKLLVLAWLKFGTPVLLVLMVAAIVLTMTLDWFAREVNVSGYQNDPLAPENPFYYGFQTPCGERFANFWNKSRNF